MRESREEKRLDWGLLTAAGAIVASLELLWNLFLGRFPIYALPTYSPLPALFLNSAIHIIFTVAILLTAGLIFSAILRRRFSASGFLAVSAAFYVFYSGYTVLLRKLSLVEFESIPLGLNPGELFTLLWFCVVGAVFIAWRKLLRRRGERPQNPAWPAMIFLSAVIASVAVLLRWPETSAVYLIPAVAALGLLHWLGWFVTRRFRPRLGSLTVFLLFLVFLATGARGGWSMIGERFTRPDIVMLVWDTVRADRMPLYGYDNITMPATEALGENALIFNRAHSSANYTYPSHASIFTGFYNRQHGQWTGTTAELKTYAGLETLPEVLREMGYRTVMITENLWLISIRKGFQTIIWLDTRGTPIDHPSPENPILSATPQLIGQFPSNCPGPFLVRQFLGHLRYWLEGYYKYVIDDYELGILERELVLRRRGQPVFFFLNWMNAHNRCHPYRTYPVGKAISPYPMSEEYDLAMSYLDKRLEALLEVFRRAGTFDDTVFIITSDHGEMLGEYGLYAHRKTLFEPVLHVPLLISYPVWSRPWRINAPASLTNLKTAIEMLAGAGTPEWETAFELAEIFLPRPGIVAEHRSKNVDPEGEYPEGYAYLDPMGDKFIYDPTLPLLKNIRLSDVYFTFDLASDPWEMNNLYEKDPRLANRLEELYETWRDNTPEVDHSSAGDDLPADLKARLRAMGYL